MLAAVPAFQPLLPSRCRFLPIVRIVSDGSSKGEIRIDSRHEKARSRTIGLYVLTRRLVDRPRENSNAVE